MLQIRRIRDGKYNYTQFMEILYNQYPEGCNYGLQVTSYELQVPAMTTPGADARLISEIRANGGGQIFIQGADRSKIRCYTELLKTE